MNGTAELKTKRLRLRKHIMEDAGILFEKFGRDPAMSEYTGWNPYASKELAEESIRKIINNYHSPDFYGWAIEYNGQLIGTIGAYDFDEDKNRIEVGMSIERAFWGNGFATEALEKVLDYLTNHEGIATVSAWCASDNNGSRRAMEKVGMVQTSVEEDAIEVEGRRYSKLVYEYSAM